VLHAGLICEEFLSLEVATAARKWSDPYVLVLHEREKRDPTDEYLRAVSAAGGDRVKLSLAPVPLRELDSVFASGFVGLAMYSNAHGPNVADIGAASGKLAFCLRNGVPVIVSALPGLTELVTTTGCGLAVEAPSEIWNSILEISEDYDAYRSRAFQAFEERLDFRAMFDAAFGQLLEDRD
jgi:hypothetical protein